MLRRPLLLWLLAVGLILSPLYYYFERVVLGGKSPIDVVGIVTSIPALKLGAAILGPIVGALLIRVKPYSWYAMVAYVLYTLTANLVLFAQGRIQASFLPFFVLLGLIVTLYFVRTQIVSPFFNPRLRGWESDRVRFKAPVEIATPTATLVEAHTWDISPTGIFIETPHVFEAGSNLEITLRLDPEHPLKRTVQVIWSFAGNEERPQGVGAQFVMGKDDELTQQLNKVARRTHARVPFKLHVEIKEKGNFSCETFDLSRTGCYLVTDQTFSINEKLTMVLHLDGPLELEGVVVRLGTNPNGVGVRFSNTPRRLVAALKDFHARRAEA